MALTAEYIATGREFFSVTTNVKAFNREDKKRGFKVYRLRRNGATQYWKTRPDHFRIPVKYGIREYGDIVQDDVVEYYPTEAEAVEVGTKMVERMREVEEERRLASAFLSALQNQQTWELGDNGTMDTVLICLNCGHEEVCSDRDSAMTVLTEDCESCLELLEEMGE